MIKTTQRIPEAKGRRKREERGNGTTEVTGVSIETGKKNKKKRRKSPRRREEKVERGHKAAADGAAGTG